MRTMDGSADVLSPLTNSPKLAGDPSVLSGRIPMEHLKRNCQLFLQVSIEEFRRQLEAFMLTTLDTMERQYREAQAAAQEEEWLEEKPSVPDEVLPDPDPAWVEEKSAPVVERPSPVLPPVETLKEETKPAPVLLEPPVKLPLVLKAAPHTLLSGEEEATPGAGGGPLWCHTCNQSFADALPFELHVRSHELDKKCVKCFYCGKTFASFSNLKRHKKIHTGVRPHVCSFCARPFLNRSDLVRHWRIHTGERPYRCNVCQHAFKYSFNLKTHQQKYHS